MAESAASAAVGRVLRDHHVSGLVFAILENEKGPPLRLALKAAPEPAQLLRAVAEALAKMEEAHGNVV